MAFHQCPTNGGESGSTNGLWPAPNRIPKNEHSVGPPIFSLSGIKSASQTAGCGSAGRKIRKATNRMINPQTGHVPMTGTFTYRDGTCGLGERRDMGGGDTPL